MALCLLYLAGDLELNPGPPGPPVRGLCGVCMKTTRRNQSSAECSACLKPIHLKCFGPDLESVKSCSLCAARNHPASDSKDSLDDSLFLPQKLKVIPTIKGFKIIHQNIRSLSGRIDELRLIVSELHSGFHLLTFSETWAHEEITDSELEIPGYQLFRRDRGNKGGGLAVYARNDVEVMRRLDLELSTIEGLWIEVCPPKSRSFLVGTFYRPPASSNYAVKDFMTIFENNLQRATAKGKEVIIAADLNCELMAKRTTAADCKQLKALLRT